MDGVGRINGKLFPELPRLEKSETPRPGGQGWQVEAASLEISVKYDYVRAAGGPGEGAAENVRDLLERIKQRVRDLFDANGLEWKNLTPQEAQAKIAKGGDQAPDAVARRIVDFVGGFANGSAERAQLLRDAVEKGFDEAAAAWGGTLPDVSYQTRDLVRKGLDELFAPRPAESGARDPQKVDLAA